MGLLDRVGASEPRAGESTDDCTGGEGKTIRSLPADAAEICKPYNRWANEAISRGR